MNLPKSTILYCSLVNVSPKLIYSVLSCDGNIKYFVVVEIIKALAIVLKIASK